LSPVDPRFGTRYIPAWGHKGVKFGAHWLVAAALLRDRNPERARALAWAWKEVGKPRKSHHSGSFGRWAMMHADLLNQVEEDYIPEQFRSQWLPGVGAVMRAHAGDPDETYLSLRQGYLASHSDANQGDFILYSRGAPLVPKSLKAYALHQLQHYKKLYNEFGRHNRVRFLFLTRPSGLDRLPTLVLDGQTYAPGTSGHTLMVPILEGEHQMELRALKQPPIVRNWQEWEDRTKDPNQE
jgi:hypothetical protein